MSESYNCPPFLLPEAVIEIKILMDSLLLYSEKNDFLAKKVDSEEKFGINCGVGGTLLLLRSALLAFDSNCSSKSD